MVGRARSQEEAWRREMADRGREALSSLTASGSIGSQAVGAIRSFVRRERERLRTLHRMGAGGLELGRLLSDLLDLILCGWAARGLEDPQPGLGLGARRKEGRAGVALCALGGYGRREMCPASDVDLLLLVAGAPPPWLKESYSRLLYFLWDLGLVVGHAIRTPRETLALAKRDLVTCTTMLGIRLLSGDGSLVEDLDREIRVQALPRHRKKLLEPLPEDDADTLLEPELKTGRGGLRDAQRLLWMASEWGGGDGRTVRGLADLARGRLLDKEDGRAFVEACDFVLRVRHELHFTAKRRQDRLAREYQEAVAHSLGYRTRGRKLAVEALLHELYRRSGMLAGIVESVLDSCAGTKTLKVHRVAGTTDFVAVDGRLEVAPGRVSPFRGRPALLMDAFRLAAESRLVPGPGLLALVRSELRLMDRRLRADPAVCGSFVRLLQAGATIYPVLHSMHRSGLLDRFIPEFGRTAFHVQHDFIHRYTTDEHALTAVGRLAALYAATEPPLGKYADLLRAVHRPEVLFLATLLHDVGKPGGTGHAERGSVAAAKAARRLAFDAAEIEDVRFLVASHLLATHTAERRDLEDPRTVTVFRETVKSTERLRMLLLLTYADRSSMSRDSWTDWRDTLLWELYRRTSAELDGLPLVEAGRDEEWEPAGREAPTVERPLVWSVVHRHDRGFSEIALAARDRLGLFADIAGVLSARGLNILGAQIRTRADGIAVDRFQVADSRGSMIEDPRRVTDAIEDLESVIGGTREVEEVMAAAARVSGVRPRPTARNDPPRVRVDFAGSDDSTVIEVAATDRVGLLALIARTISSLGLDIRSARIATERSLALDVFYVRDRRGRKLTDDGEIARVGQAIIAALGAKDGRRKGGSAPPPAG